MRHPIPMLAGLTAFVLAFPANAGIVTVNFQGTVGFPGQTGAFVVKTNSYLGLINAFDIPTYNAGAVETIFPTGTLFTGQLRFDTNLIPPAVNSTQTSLDPNVPTPTHSQTGTIQWVGATIQIGGFSFTTVAKPEDAPPQPAQGDSLVVNTPLQYRNTLSYGMTPTWGLGFIDVNGFTATSAVQTSHMLLASQGGGISISRASDFYLFLYRYFSTLPFGESNGAPPFPFTWEDTGINDNGFGNGSFSDITTRSFVDAGEFMLQVNEISGRFTGGFEIASAQTGVPEPASIALAAIGLACLIARRCRFS